MPCMRSQFHTAPSLLSRLVLWVATGLGIGLVAPAPGTVGGLWGLPLAYGTLLLPTTGTRFVVLVALLLLSVPVCSRAAYLLGKRDPQEVVLDEIAVLPLVFLITGATPWTVLVTGWLLFRIFDIIKPPPVRQAELLPAGWGIVADDVIAALYAAIALRILVWLDAIAQWGVFAGAAGQ